MDEITCGVCMDLIPLVQDGVASEESRRAVERHIASCAACRAVYGGEPPRQDGGAVLKKVRRKLRFLTALLMMLGIFFGISLTGSEDIFCNILIMPLIGALGYSVFRWRAVYGVPLLLLAFQAVSGLLAGLRTGDWAELWGLFWWTFFYVLFALLGVLIAGLFHFAFHREDRHET